MEESILFNYKSILENNYNHLVSALGKYKSSDKTLQKYLKEIDSIYEHKLNDIKPYIMVYGIYNAGKSTIINELLGEDIAKVNDKPETDRVNEYEWNGYIIADTPGVGAPIEHEQVTENHLRKADIVMFVMSSTGSNEKAENYKRLQAIVNAGKKVIIVLNDKNGDLYSNDQELAMIIRKVKDNMAHYHLESRDFVISVVNAKRARDGRIKNKSVLVEKSNILELKGILLAELKKTDCYTIINNAILDIQFQITCIQDYLESYNNDTEIDSLKGLLKKIRAYKKSLKATMKDVITIKVNQLLPVVESDIWASRENTNHIQEIFQEHMESLSNTIVQNLESNLEEVTSDIFADINDVAEEISLKLSEVEGYQAIHFDKINSQNDKTFNVSGISSDSDIDIDNLKDILNISQELLMAYKKDKSIIPIISSGLGLSEIESLGLSEVGSTILGGLAKTSLGSAIRSTVIGKMLSSGVGIVMPYVPFILAAGTILKNIFFGGKSKDELQAEINAKNEAELRRKDALKDARNDLHSKLVYAFDGILTDYQNQINKIIDNLLGNFEKLYRDKENNFIVEKESYDNIMNVISYVKASYEQLSVILHVSADKVDRSVNK